MADIIPDQFRDTASAQELRDERSKQFDQDPELSNNRLLWYLVGLSRRANVVEKGTIQLLTGLMTISGDERLVDKIGSTEPFPAEFEAEYICHAVGQLSDRVDKINRWAEDRRPRLPTLTARQVAAKGRATKDVRSIFDTMLEKIFAKAEGREFDVSNVRKSPPLLEDDCLLERNTPMDDERRKDEDPVCSMYKDMPPVEVHTSITDEVNQMKKEFNKILIDHEGIRSSFEALKGQMTWNLLCKCYSEVDDMRNAIQKMTDGEMDYVQPSKVDELIVKLKFVQEKLCDMDKVLHAIPQEQKQDLLDSCVPILIAIGLAELKEDVTQEDLATARDISDRTRGVKLMIEYCSELIADMITQLARRMLLLWQLEAKLEMLIEIKADKEYFFNVIDEKADKSLVAQLVTNCFMEEQYQLVTRLLCDYLLMIMKKMMMWIESLKTFQKAVQCSVEDEEYEIIKNKIFKTLDTLNGQVCDLQCGYEDYDVNINKYHNRPFKGISCFADNTPAVMYNKYDTGLPIFDACPPREHIGPDIAFNLDLLREGLYEETDYDEKHPCLVDVCPRDFKEETVCAICLGHTKSPCRLHAMKAKRKVKPILSIKDVKFDDDREKVEEESDEDGSSKKGKKRKSKASNKESESVVKEILKGLF